MLSVLYPLSTLCSLSGILGPCTYAVLCSEEHTLHLPSHLPPALTPARFLYFSLLSPENPSQTHCSGCCFPLLGASVISLTPFHLGSDYFCF